MGNALYMYNDSHITLLHCYLSFQLSYMQYTFLLFAGKRSPVKSKNELSFDSEDDLPGIEESPRPKPKTKQTPNKPTPKKKVDDLFGDDDGLFGKDLILQKHDFI